MQNQPSLTFGKCQQITVKALLAVAAALCASAASAIPLSYASSGLANATYSIDFAGIAPDTILGATYAAQGISFTELRTTNDYGDLFPPSVAPAAVNFDPDLIRSRVFEFDFTPEVRDLTFFMLTSGTGGVVTSYLRGVPLESFDIITTGPVDNSGFFGFTDTLIDRVVFSIDGDGLAYLDNLAFNTATDTIPEPGSLALVVAGLVGFAASKWKRGRGLVSTESEC